MANCSLERPGPAAVPEMRSAPMRGRPGWTRRPALAAQSGGGSSRLSLRQGPAAHRRSQALSGFGNAPILKLLYDRLLRFLPPLNKNAEFGNSAATAAVWGQLV